MRRPHRKVWSPSNCADSTHMDRCSWRVSTHAASARRCGPGANAVSENMGMAVSLSSARVDLNSASVSRPMKFGRRGARDGPSDMTLLPSLKGSWDNVAARSS